MNKVIFYIPTEKLTLTPDFKDTLAKVYGGYTESNAIGAWCPYGHYGKVYIDNNIKFEVLTTLVDDLKQWLIRLNKSNWHEHCIYFEIQNNFTIEFIS